MQTDRLARGLRGRQTIYQRILSLAVLCLLLILSGCDVPRIQAEDRLFLPLSLELLDESVLPSQEIEKTRIGGLSAITYDRQTGNYYALSDDRGFVSPARFYTLSIDIGGKDPDLFQIRKITIKDVTLLRDEAGELFPPRHH